MLAHHRIGCNWQQRKPYHAFAVVSMDFVYTPPMPLLTETNKNLSNADE